MPDTTPSYMSTSTTSTQSPHPFPQPQATPHDRLIQNFYSKTAQIIVQARLSPSSLKQGTPSPSAPMSPLKQNFGKPGMTGKQVGVMEGRASPAPLPARATTVGAGSSTTSKSNKWVCGFCPGHASLLSIFLTCSISSLTRISLSSHPFHFFPYI
ncbi:hypothetical protein BC829DRAFT_249457 [Chytridium lagenaria]|nr:hypothetical protein BC829DRAFT_249457 [Chytridium lagenaria]